MWSKRVRSAFALVAVPAIMAIAACDDDPLGPGPDEGEVEFTFDDGAGSFSASGALVLNGGVPDFDEWAVAAEPDSVGGVVVTAFMPSATQGEGDLFLLQIQPVDGAGTYEPCAANEECRGRLFRGWRTDGSGFDEWFEVVSGTVEIDDLSDTRIRGSFELTLRDEGGEGDTELVIEDGDFDVPVSSTAGIFYCDLPDAVGC